MWYAAVIIGCLLIGSIIGEDDLHPLSDEFIEIINTKATTWTAGKNFDPSTSMEAIKKLMGVNPDSRQYLPELEENSAPVELPEAFDAREQWPDCPTLKEIRDQGCCGSCWAFGAVEAMSDRVCIHSKGKTHIHFSAADVVACCHACGSGCDGGSPEAAWVYWKTNGIVSGGPLDSGQGCFPYPIGACKSRTQDDESFCETDHYDTPNCTRTCQASYNVPYQEDKHYGKSYYSVASNAKAIQNEILTNGPVEAAFTVFEDFVSYRSGVYQHVHGKKLAGHAIKILGWGVENGVDYWLIANSWNYYWGDDGFFKMIRGQNNCGIEDQISAGLPKLD